MAKGRRHRALLTALAAAWLGLAVAPGPAQAQEQAQEAPDEANANDRSRGASETRDASTGADDANGANGANGADDAPLGPSDDATDGGRLDANEGYVYDDARTDEERRAEEQRRIEEDRAAAATWAQEQARQRRPAARLVDVSAAAMPGAYAIAGISHRGDPMAAVELQLGGVAAVGAGYDDRLLIGDTAEDAEVQGRRTAWFRVGVEAGRWFAQQPALDLTFQRSNGDGEVHMAELRLGATRSWRSQRFGSLDLTAGAGLWEVAGDGPRLSDQALGKRLRPYGGVAWTPPSYPRTSLLFEGSYGPSMIGGAPRLDWRLGWGARYQVFSWSAIDLVVRNRQDAGLPGSTVMVRLSAQLH